jgi:NAD+ kinase
MNTFKKVALFSRRQMTPPMVETLAVVSAFLQEQKLEVIWEKETADAMGPVEGKVLSAEEIGKNCDLAIVVGGDGCLLGASHALVDYNIPIVGVNRGQLGFLTDINPHDVSEELKKILDGEYTEEHRFLLNAQIYSAEGKVMLEHVALNEVALYAGHAAQLLEFEVFIDKQFVYNQRSDGLIVATPTG